MEAKDSKECGERVKWDGITTDGNRAKRRTVLPFGINKPSDRLYTLCADRRGKKEGQGFPEPL